MKIIASGRLRDGREFRTEEEFHSEDELTLLVRGIRVRARRADIEVKDVPAIQAMQDMALGASGRWEEASSGGRLIRIAALGGRA